MFSTPAIIMGTKDIHATGVNSRCQLETVLVSRYETKTLGMRP